MTQSFHPFTLGFLSSKTSFWVVPGLKPVAQLQLQSLTLMNNSNCLLKLKLILTAASIMASAVSNSSQILFSTIAARSAPQDSDSSTSLSSISQISSMPWSRPEEQLICMRTNWSPTDQIQGYLWTLRNHQILWWTKYLTWQGSNHSKCMKRSLLHQVHLLIRCSMCTTISTLTSEVCCLKIPCWVLLQCFSLSSSSPVFPLQLSSHCVCSSSCLNSWVSAGCSMKSWVATP